MITGTCIPGSLSHSRECTRLLLKPTFLDDGKLKVDILIEGRRTIEDTVVLSETTYDVREWGYAVFTLQHILEGYYSELSGPCVNISILLPRDYCICSPVFHRHPVHVVVDDNITLYSIKVDNFNFSKFVFYEAFVVGLESVISIRRSERLEIVYTQDVPTDFVEAIAEAYSRAIEVYLRKLGYSPVYPRVIVISGPNHHASYRRGHMSSIGDSTVYMKLFEVPYRLEWYIKNLYHEMTHGWSSWPVLYGDFTVNEGIAEYISWIMTKEIYPELFRLYDKNNIKWRIEQWEDYAVAAIKQMALNFSLVYMSMKYNSSIDLYDYLRFLIEKYNYSGKRIPWNIYLGRELIEFLKRGLNITEEEALVIQRSIDEAINELKIEYRGYWNYFDKSRLIEILNRSSEIEKVRYRLDELEQKLEAHKTMVYELKLKLDELAIKVDELETRLIEILNRGSEIEAVKHKLNELEQRMEAHKAIVCELKLKLDELAIRVSELETKFAIYVVISVTIGVLIGLVIGYILGRKR